MPGAALFTAAGLLGPAHQDPPPPSLPVLLNICGQFIKHSLAPEGEEGLRAG